MYKRDLQKRPTKIPAKEVFTCEKRPTNRPTDKEPADVQTRPTKEI